MSKIRIFIVAALASVAFSTAYARDYEPLPKGLDGSMMPYDFSKADETYTIPDSLQAVYVGYVARHGARYLSSEKKIHDIEKFLLEANAQGQLSSHGKEFLSLLGDITQATDGKWGQLSPIGIEEERELGKEMLKTVPNLFEKGKANSISSFVPRVIMSNYEFNHAVELPNQFLELYVSSGHQNDSLLYFFDFNPDYKAYRDSGAWEQVYDEFVSRHVSAEPARRLFAKGYDDSEKHLQKLTMAMYSVLQGCRAGGFNPPTTQWMSEEEYKGCWLASNLKHYLRNTPNKLNTSCVVSVAPLVKRIISDADGALALVGEMNDVKMSCYFGHAETLLPLFSVLRLPGFYTDEDNYEKLHKRWVLQDLTPLAANVAIIFMRPVSGSEETYVSVKLNGKITEPFPGAGKIVPWSQLKQRWLSLIE